MYNEKTKKGKFIVFKTSEEDKARTIAKKKGFHLAGGLFTANAKPYDFKRNYKVINVPESTKETIDPNDDIIRAALNEEGSIDFEVKYYNGGASMQEAIVSALKKLNL